MAVIGIRDLEKVFRDYQEELDWKHVMNIISKITSFRDNALGFRLAGGDAEHKLAKFIYSEFKRIGVDEVELHEVPVDKWIFKKSWVSIEAPAKGIIEATAYAGHKPGVVEGEFIYVGRGTIEDYRNRDVNGKIVLIEIDSSLYNSTILPIYEAHIRGAKGVIVTHHKSSGVSSELDDTRYTSDGEYFDGFPVVVHISRGDFRRILELLKDGEVWGSIGIEASTDEGYGYNVIGIIRGKDEDKIILSAHHDAHYIGAVDNASGVALLLSLAEAYIGKSEKLDKTLVFVSFTAEEYGKINTIYDYLIGSYYFFRDKIKDLRDTWLYLNFDGVGESGGPIGLIYTPEVEDFLMGIVRKISGQLKSGVSLSDRPSLWLDQWPGVYHGLSSIALTNRGHTEFYSKYYHTHRDIPALLDVDIFRSFYGFTRMVIDTIDSMHIPPYNIGRIGSKIMGDLNKTLVKRIGREDFLHIISKLTAEGEFLYGLISGLNRGDEVFNESKMRMLRKSILKIRKIILKNLFYIDGFNPGAVDPVYVHQPLQELITILKRLLSAIDNGEQESIRKSIERLPSLSWGRFFSRETYRWMLIKSSDEHYWSKNKVLEPIDLYTILDELRSKSDIRPLTEDLIYVSEKKMSRVLASEGERLSFVTEIISSLNQMILEEMDFFGNKKNTI